MSAKRPAMRAAAALLLIALSGAAGLAADDPRGLEPGQYRFGRPVNIAPGTVPEAPLLSAGDNTAEPSERGNPLWGIPLESLHFTRERPLFTPSRRPPMPAVISTPAPEPVKVAMPPVETDDPRLSLLGIIVGGGEGYAVFVSNTTHDIVRLKIGEAEDGWILVSVNDRKAVLEKNHRSAVVRLPSANGEQK